MSGWNIFYGLINFAILAGALFLIGRKMVKGIFGRHRDEVARGLEQSEKAAETARELLQSLPQVTARGEEDLAQIGREGEEALQRIRNGTFGICKVCKQLIPKARLMAVPTATKCVNCKEETKKKEQENNRMEMARLFAEAQRKEMQKRAAGR